jgi:hypothetical protein
MTCTVGLGVFGACDATSAPELQETCILEGRYSQTTEMSDRVWNALAESLIDVDSRVLGGELYPSGAGRFAVEMQGDCDSARSYWRHRLQQIAVETNDPNLASELLLMNATWREISRQELETILPAGEQSGNGP